jgi:DNA topoisomerase III
VTDHHAIIPTEQPLKGAALNGDEQKLYDMIARRFIALFYEPHRTVQQTYIIEIKGERFVAKGRKVLEEGWRKAQGLRSAEEVQLPGAAQGDTVTLVEADCTRQQTKPPGKYSEGQLLSVMEKHQLGTPATRADIIEKLLKTNSIERRGNHLEPTAKGRQLMDLVVDDLRSPTLTAHWEKQLEAIARGTGDQNRFLKDIYNQTETIVGKIKDSRQSYQKSYAKKLSRKRCPHCKKKLEIRQGKKGPFLQCKPCQHIEQMQKGKGIQSRDTNKMVRKYSDDVTLGNNLGDALKKALGEQKEK